MSLEPLLENLCRHLSVMNKMPFIEINSRNACSYKKPLLLQIMTRRLNILSLVSCNATKAVVLNLSQKLKVFNVQNNAQKILMSSVIFTLIFAVAVSSLDTHAQNVKANKSTKAATQKNQEQEVVTKNSNPNDIDSVIAVVNSAVITQKELTDRIVVVRKQFLDSKAPMPPANEMERQVLERLIIEEIQYQEAKNRGVRVNDEELDGFIANMATQQKKTMAEYKAGFEKQGISYAKHREDFRRQVMVSRIREREVDSKIKISDSDVDNFIAARNTSLGIGVGTGAGAAANSSASAPVHLAQILVPISEGASPNEINAAREKAQQILAQAQTQKDFLQFANGLARLDSKVRAQDLGMRTPDRLPTLFVEATQNLNSGQMAEVLQSPAGFHVIKVVDKPTAKAPQQTASKATVLAGGVLLVPQNEVRHILLKMRPGQNEEETARRLTTFRDQVRLKVADFGGLAKRYSEDPQSAPNNGLIGWVTPGQLPPEFEQAVVNMQPGQVSDPVRTEFGWHLIQLLNRKQTELTQNQQKEFARATLRQNKFDQAYQDWLRELRDAATVELRGSFTPNK